MQVTPAFPPSSVWMTTLLLLLLLQQSKTDFSSSVDAVAVPEALAPAVNKAATSFKSAKGKLVPFAQKIRDSKVVTQLKVASDRMKPYTSKMRDSAAARQLKAAKAKVTPYAEKAKKALPKTPRQKAIQKDQRAALEKEAQTAFQQRPAKSMPGAEPDARRAESVFSRSNPSTASLAPSEAASQTTLQRSNAIRRPSTESTASYTSSSLERSNAIRRPSTESTASYTSSSLERSNAIRRPDSIFSRRNPSTESLASGKSTESALGQSQSVSSASSRGTDADSIFSGRQAESSAASSRSSMDSVRPADTVKPQSASASSDSLLSQESKLSDLAGQKGVASQTDGVAKMGTVNAKQPTVVQNANAVQPQSAVMGRADESVGTVAAAKQPTLVQNTQNIPEAQSAVFGHVDDVW